MAWQQLGGLHQIVLDDGRVVYKWESPMSFALVEIEGIGIFTVKSSLWWSMAIHSLIEGEKRNGGEKSSSIFSFFLSSARGQWESRRKRRRMGTIADLRTKREILQDLFFFSALCCISKKQWGRKRRGVETSGIRLCKCRLPLVFDLISCPYRK